MKNTTLFYVINFLYMEFIFHFYSYQDIGCSFLLAIPLCVFISILQSFLMLGLKGRANRILFGVFLFLDYMLFASQMVYQSVFKQPLLLDAVILGGGNALTNYWRETIQAIMDTGLGLVALTLGIVWIVVIHNLWRRDEVTQYKKIAIGYGVGLLSSMLCIILSFVCLYTISSEKYEDYQSFSAPADVLEQYGVVATWIRDSRCMYLPDVDVVEGWFGDTSQQELPKTETVETESVEYGENQETVSTETESIAESEIIETEVVEVYEPQILNVDYELLKELGSDAVDQVTDYVYSLEPSMENEYTGMFEGHNLIYITAEGFSTAAIDENLTPTLYQLTHSGVVVPEYYVPLWQTSTSDGEYVNLTGLIPDQQFSMQRTAENSQPFSLANYFKAEGANAYAYHNNTLSYYKRHLSHPNLGYQFKASKLGELSEAEWGSNIFPMEHPNYWPSSDLEMMQATIPEYIQDERFHVYYMTVSGHMNYSFTGNKMSSIHKEEVASLPYAEEGKAYVACNIELDRALAYLIEQLDAAGKLDNTVICLSADHYPYGMTVSVYEELLGRKVENSLDIYRNSLILWNSKMETVVVDEPCSAMDLMPTLLNLFGFEFDSRLYSGRDIFSDKEPFVVFANRSFITDKVSYNKKTGEVLSRTEEPVDEAYIDNKKDYVKLLHKHASGIINNNYYEYFKNAIH